VLGPPDGWQQWAPLLLTGAEEVFYKNTNDALSAAWFSCVAAMTWRANSAAPLMQLIAHVNACRDALQVDVYIYIYTHAYIHYSVYI